MLFVHTPGPTGVEVGREGWQVGCDDHPIPCSSHPSHLFEARTRPFKPLQGDHQPIANSDGDDKTAGRCLISSFGSIFLTPQSCRRTRGGGALGGIDSATITTARASGVRSGAALPPPSDDGVMAPPRSLCVFSFLRVYIISTFVARVYTAHRFVSLSTPTMKFATLIILACLCVTAKSLGSLRVEDKSSNKATTAAELTQAHDPKINDDAIVNADEQAEADWGLKGSVREAMVCTPLWYINCDGVCVMSCEVDIGGSCGGLAMPWVPLFDKKLVCCEKKLTSIGVTVYEQQLFRDSCLASCHSPTPAPANTSSKNPSTNPSSNPSGITITIINHSTNPSSNPSSSPSSKASKSPISNCFPDRAALKSAVDAYIDPATAATANLQFGPIGLWCTKLVTDMSSLFDGNLLAAIGTFNEDINGWQVGQVTNMEFMFSFASVFNQQLNGWNVSRVTTMNHMFNNAAAFNQPLDGWQVGKVTDMSAMFNMAHAFNQPLNGWDVSSVTTMQVMFLSSIAFNQPLNGWNVSSVTSMLGMFSRQDIFESNFNQPLTGWDVSSVTTMQGMFFLASKFNQNLCPWGSKMMFPNVNVFIMFASSGCPDTADPTGPSGPWCAVTNCTA